MDPGGDSNKTVISNAESGPSDNVVSLSAEKDVKAATRKPSKLQTSNKGVENAKKRLRAFSIQKKPQLTPVVVPKASGSTNTTVIIGKLAGVKVTPKVEPDPEQKKLKPPKPGAARRSYQDSYIELQRRTLSEIEDMKRKMELVELGIPLGLICPTSTSEKAMPTKAMPPIKSLLDPAKVDDLIREAKKAKQEGKAYKFNYQKLLPDYDNPFQKKKEELLLQHERERKSERRKSESDRDRDRERDKRRNDKYVSKRHDYKRDSTYKERDKDKARYDDRDLLDDKETDVNLNDYLVCDSWSLENDDKSSISSPKVEKSSSSVTSITSEKEKEKVTVPNETVKTLKKNEVPKTCPPDSPRNMPIKIEKLKPVMDSFKFEIDPNDEFLDIFDEDSDLDKYAQQTKARHRSFYDSPEKSIVDYELENVKDSSMDGMNDDTFLESVINEIKQENMSDDGSQDKGLVEYEMSPNRDEESPQIQKRSSVTPEIDDKIRNQSRRSDYSDGYRSSDSFKSVLTTESGYKSVESYRLSVEKELNEAIGSNMSKSTVDSLETWSFVLKICQPLLFRHDRNKCYKETQTSPKLWYIENPKACNCVKDRSVVYEELEMLKMSLVDRVYGCDQIPDAPFPKSRKWYPRNTLYSTENNPVPLSSEWEAEDSQLADRGDRGSACATPQRSDELTLDREYQRFMEAVWPDVVESKKETSRSTTPIRQESRKKKKEDADKENYIEKKPKKLKLSSEGWSQESDMEEEDKSKKHKMEKGKPKNRKRKHSTSTLSSCGSESDEDVRKRRKLLKKKAIKKAKSKSAKRRRIGRKLLKKLKDKQKRRNKEQQSEDDIDKKKAKSKKRKQQKLKIKALKKKKVKVESSTSSSSSSSDSTDSESGNDRKSKKAKKKGQEGKKKKIKKQRQQSSSESTQSEDLFDVNILNNIKTERLTDDEKCHKMMDFSPRRHPSQPREIINVKELQNDFVGNIHIKQEVEDIPKEVLKEMPDEIQEEISNVPMDPVEDVKPVPGLKIENTDLDNIAVPKVSAEPVYPIQEVTPVPLPLPQPVPIPTLDESNMSQTSSQESVCSVSVKDAPIFYEKDESHLRPSSQNSNYSFNDVISASQNIYLKDINAITAHQHTLYDKELEINVDQALYSKEIDNFSTSQNDYGKRIEVTTSDNSLYDKDIDVETECEDKYGEGYEAANYEMYEHMAMAYQSDVASQQRTSIEGVGEGESQRIETVVGARIHGEIKCDWRAGDAPATPHRTQRPSRWGLKPGEVNIVLTGGNGPFPVPDEAQPVYHIQSLANRTDINTGYDEAYMDMYGAADRLQYGDCFGDGEHVAHVVPASVDVDTVSPNITPLSGNIHHLSPNVTQIPVSSDAISTIDTVPKEVRTSSLDDRINKALRETMLGGIAKEIDADKETSDRGILVTTVQQESRGAKRVSFADGYKPGQDSDIEEPPVKKRKRNRRYGCAWPCPASHPDHVPLWDALPPPPPPPGSPPPQYRAAPPLHLLRPPPRHGGLLAIPTPVGKYDPTIPMQGFMPPEPPPGLIALQ